MPDGIEDSAAGQLDTDDAVDSAIDAVDQVEDSDASPADSEGDASPPEDSAAEDAGDSDDGDDQVESEQKLSRSERRRIAQEKRDAEIKERVEKALGDFRAQLDAERQKAEALAAQQKAAEEQHRQLMSLAAPMLGDSDPDAEKERRAPRTVEKVNAALFGGREFDDAALEAMGFESVREAKVWLADKAQIRSVVAEIGKRQQQQAVAWLHGSISERLGKIDGIDMARLNAADATPATVIDIVAEAVEKQVSAEYTKKLSDAQGRIKALEEQVKTGRVREAASGPRPERSGATPTTELTLERYRAMSASEANKLTSAEIDAMWARHSEQAVG